MSRFCYGQVLKGCMVWEEVSGVQEGFLCFLDVVMRALHLARNDVHMAKCEREHVLGFLGGDSTIGVV